MLPRRRFASGYGHDPKRFAKFARRYRAKLGENEAAFALAHLRELAEQGTLTLLTATKHPEPSEAAAGLIDI